MLLQALIDIHQSKPMRLNMKAPVELEAMKEVDDIRRFSNKEVRLTKKSMGALTKCKNRYPVHFVAVDVKITRTIVDQAFSVPKCVKLARMSKHSRVYSAYQLDIGARAFKRDFVTNRNAMTTAVKRTSRTSECDGRETEEKLKEDQERNVKLCLHDSFSWNRETNGDPLPCCK